MCDRLKTRGSPVRNVWLWLTCGAMAVALLITGMSTIPRVFHNDPCDSALPFASELGLHLSGDDDVVSCEWHSSFPDSSGTIMVRTVSYATRDAVLERSGVSEELYRSNVSIDDGPFREEVPGRASRPPPVGPATFQVNLGDHCTPGTHRVADLSDLRNRHRPKIGRPRSPQDDAV